MQSRFDECFANSHLRYKGKDVLENFRSAIYYYENIVEDNDDEARKSAIPEIAVKLRKNLAHLEEEIQSLSHVCRLGSITTNRLIVLFRH